MEPNMVSLDVWRESDGDETRQKDPDMEELQFSMVGALRSTVGNSKY